MKRRERKESTHARILAAALECLASRDERDVSMQEIAARAGVSVGALYVHFRSRETLVDAVVAILQETIVAAVRERLLAVEDPSVPAAIHALAGSFFRLLEEHRPYFALYASHVTRTMSIDVLRTGGAGAPFLQMLNATLATLVVRAPIEGDVSLLAATIAGMWRAAALNHASRPAADEVATAATLARLTCAVLTSSCPEIMKLDAIAFVRVMAQFLK